MLKSEIPSGAVVGELFYQTNKFDIGGLEMNKTRKSDLEASKKILLDTMELQEILSCGRASAVKIGTRANAKILVGRRVLWNREKVRNYLNGVAE